MVLVTARAGDWHQAQESCCTALLHSTAHLHPGPVGSRGEEALAVAPQQGTLQPSSTVLTLGQSKAGPTQESPGADPGGDYCSSLEFAGVEVVQGKAELGPTPPGASQQLPYRIR